MRPVLVASSVLLLSLGAQAQTWVGHQLRPTGAIASPVLTDSGSGTAQGVSMRFVAERTRAVEAIWVYVEGITGTGAHTVYRVGIARNNGGDPGTLVSSSDVELPSTGWNRVEVPPAALQSGTTYHAVVQPQNVKSKVVRLRQLEPRFNLSPAESATSTRAVLHRAGSSWSVVNDRTPVFLLEGDAQDPWLLASCASTDDFDVEGNPYVDSDESIVIAGQRTPVQRFFVRGETWIERVEVLIKEPTLTGSLVPLDYELRKADANLTVVASGRLSAGTSASGGRWYGVDLPSPVKLEDGAPPLTTRYFLLLKASLAVNGISEYRWLATTSDATGATTGTCSPHVRAGYGGALSRAILIDSGNLTEQPALDAVFRLATCTATTWFEDGDGDGFGRDDRTVKACTRPAGHAAQGGDCDDADAARKPGAADLCDGADNDCDGSTDEADPDVGKACSTGLMGVCATGAQQCVGGALSCVQTATGSAERCDGEDNDCDGQIDEGNPEAGGVCTTGEPGPCRSGKLACQGGDLLCVSTHVKSAELCDGIDNDCNGTVDDAAPTALHCDDGNPCSRDVCSAGLCTHPNGPDGAVCDDGDACTSSDSCRSGRCAGAVTPGSGCGFDAASPFSASPREVVADGVAVSTLTGRAQRTTGAVLDGKVTFTCTLGTLTEPEAQPDGSWRARLRSAAPGSATCSAWGPGGKPFTAKVEVTFVPQAEAVLALTASAVEALADEPVSITATFPSGAPVESVLRISLQDGLELVPRSGRIGSEPWPVEPEPSGALIDLPTDAKGELAVTFDVRARPEALPGPFSIKGQAIRGEVPASNEAELTVRLVEVYDLGGCGCSSGTSGAGALGAVALLALRRRRKRG